MRGIWLYATLLAALVVGVPLASAAPPTPIIDMHPANPTKETSARFAFHVEPSDATLSYQCEIDGSGFAPCVSPVDYTDLPEGERTFEVRAVDVMTNPGDAASYSWAIDSKPPSAPSITAEPSNPSNDSSPTFRFSDSEDKVTFQCRLDGHPFGACTSPKVYSELRSGPHTFRVRAVDGAEKVSDVTTYRWTIDLTPPPAPSISSRPANPSTETNATFAFVDSEAGVTFRCEFDAGGFSSCTSPAAYAGLGATAHVFSVRASDAAGNTGPATSYGWTIITARDTIAPGDVTGLRQRIGYRSLRLVWSQPRDADFDHVRVFVATTREGPKALPRKVVYTGKGTRYTNKRFKNAMYHRYRIVNYDHAGNRSRGVDMVVPASALLQLPRAGAVVHAPPRLAWVRVARAAFYNVQLFFGGRKVLSAWPSGSRFGLKQRWFYSGRSFRLKKGTYSWYVWPGFGTRAKSHYGRLLGLSTFRAR
jgi:hypothetical protein